MLSAPCLPQTESRKNVCEGFVSTNGETLQSHKLRRCAFAFAHTPLHRAAPSLDGVRVVVRHRVQEWDRLVGVDGDEDVTRVGVDVVVVEAGVQEAQQRGLVQAVEFRRVLR